MALIAIAILIVTGLSISESTFLISGQPGTACLSETNYILDSVEFNETGDEVLLIRITNHGKMEVYGFGVSLTNDTSFLHFSWDSPLLDQGNIDQTNRLETGRSIYLKIDMSDYPVLGQTLTEMVVTNQACPLYQSRASVT